MKKFLCILLSLLLLAGFAACGDSEEQTAETTEATTKQDTPTVPPEPTTYKLVFTRVEGENEVGYALCANGNEEKLGAGMYQAVISADGETVLYSQFDGDIYRVYTKQPNEKAVVVSENAYGFACVSDDLILMTLEDGIYSTNDPAKPFSKMNGITEVEQFSNAFLSADGNWLYLMNLNNQLYAVDLKNGNKTNKVGYMGAQQQLTVMKDSALYIPSNNPGKAFLISGNTMETMTLSRVIPGANVVSFMEDGVEKVYILSYEYGLVAITGDENIISASADSAYVVMKQDGEISRYTLTAEGFADERKLQGDYAVSLVLPDGKVAISGVGGVGLSIWDGTDILNVTTSNIKLSSVACYDGVFYYIADLASAKSGKLYSTADEAPLTDDIYQIIAVI